MENKAKLEKLRERALNKDELDAVESEFDPETPKSGEMELEAEEELFMEERDVISLADPKPKIMPTADDLPEGMEFASRGDEDNFDVRGDDLEE